MPSPQPPSGRVSPRLVLLAAWNLRLLGLFVVGPAMGALLGTLTFAMPVPLRWSALGMFGFILVLLGILVRDEVRRLARTAAPR